MNDTELDLGSMMALVIFWIVMAALIATVIVYATRIINGGEEIMRKKELVRHECLKSCGELIDAGRGIYACRIPENIICKVQ